MFGFFERKKMNGNNGNVYFEAEICGELKKGVQSGALLLNDVCGAIAEKFNGVKWCKDTVWALLENEEIAQKFIRDTKEKKAHDLSLECGFATPSANLSEDQKANRRVVNAMCKETTAPLEKLLEKMKWSAGEIQQIKDFLRAGVFVVQGCGQITIAPNFAQLLEEFCTLRLVTEEEKDFYNAAKSLVSATMETRAAYCKLSDLLGRERDKKAVKGWAYQFDRLRVCDGMTILGDGMPWRAVLNFVIRYRENDTPHYYNRVGAPNLGVKRVKELLGYLPLPTPFLRAKFPELYENVAYRGMFESSVYGVDNEKELEEVQKSGIEIDDNGRPVVKSAFYEDVPALAVDVLYER